MRRWLAAILALAAVLFSVMPVRADDGTEALVAVVWGQRTHDPNLHQLAHRRAVEVSCANCFDHSGRQGDTWEVLVWSSGFVDPIAHGITQWQLSPDHDAILRNPLLTRIGCGSYSPNPELGLYRQTFTACVLASDVPVAGDPLVIPPTAVPLLIPPTIPSDILPLLIPEPGLPNTSSPPNPNTAMGPPTENLPLPPENFDMNPDSPILLITGILLLSYTLVWAIWTLVSWVRARQRGRVR